MKSEKYWPIIILPIGHEPIGKIGAPLNFKGIGMLIYWRKGQNSPRSLEENIVFGATSISPTSVLVL